MTIRKKSLHQKIEKLDIDVLGFPYKVSIMVDLMKKFNVNGCASIWGSEIQIDPDVSNLDLFATVIHEILELMARKTETKCEHELISRFETFFMMILIRNPELVEMILDVAKKETRPSKDFRKKKIKGMVQGSKRK